MSLSAGCGRVGSTEARLRRVTRTHVRGRLLISPVTGDDGKRSHDDGVPLGVYTLGELGAVLDFVVIVVGMHIKALRADAVVPGCCKSTVQNGGRTQCDRLAARALHAAHEGLEGAGGTRLAESSDSSFAERAYAAVVIGSIPFEAFDARAEGGIGLRIFVGGAKTATIARNFVVGLSHFAVSAEVVLSDAAEPAWKTIGARFVVDCGDLTGRTRAAVAGAREANETRFA